MSDTRRIAVLTTARSDYGILRPIIAGVMADAGLELALLVGGAHLSPRFGRTETAIQADGFPIAERLSFLLDSDSPDAVAHSMGLATSAVAGALGRLRPHILVLLGDRWETLAAASAASVMGIPIAHLHGGELTLGALDDCFRHAITKLSHLHFAATEEYAARLRQLGEENWRITVSGAPGLDAIRACTPLSRDALSARLGRTVPERFLLATFHPVTTEPDRLETHISEMMAALDQAGTPVLFTYAGADAGGAAINAAIEHFCRHNPDSMVMPSLGSEVYFAAMAHASAMVGNSSSGIIEAASFRLPVVNVGRRQEGRARGANVIDCGHGRADIAAAIARATSDVFRASWRDDFRNPYDYGGATGIILGRLASVPLGPELTVKGFVDRRGGAS